MSRLRLFFALVLAAAGAEGQASAELEDLARQVERAPSYDGWVQLGLAYGREQQLGPARRALDTAVVLDPRRAEAFVERGGLSFIEKDYKAAARDLEAALRLAPDDRYARDLLASSLQLGGRSDEALGQWNRLGQPLVGQVALAGLVHTRERLVRRELPMRAGDLLELDDLRVSRLRLVELGVFERATVRLVPKGAGVADVEAAFVERHGFASSPVDFAVATAVQAVQGRVRLRYTNLAGLGFSLGGEYRFQPNRPELSLFGDVPRPFGWPLVARVLGFRGRQLYDSGGPFTRRARGLELGARHVQGPRLVLELGLQARDRQFSVARPDLPPGWIAGPTLGADVHVFEHYRQRLDARAALFWAAPVAGSPVEYTRAELGLVYKLHLSPPEGALVEPSVLAWQVKGGHLSGGAPLDEGLAAGSSPDMSWPLRARRKYEGGTLGASTPLGPTLWLSNLEWRRRVHKGALAQAGLVAFYDAALQGLGGRHVQFHDLGLGLRFGFRGGPLLRLDWGHGMTDGRNALSLGLGYFF